MDLTAAQELPRGAELTTRQKQLRNAKIDRRIKGLEEKMSDSSKVLERRIAKIEDRYTKKVIKATGFLDALKGKKERYDALERILPLGDQERMRELEKLLDETFTSLKGFEIAAAEKEYERAIEYFESQIAVQKAFKS